MKPVIARKTDFGTIEISLTAIASLVSAVSVQTYGVVGMAVPTRAGQLAATLTRDPNKGIAVKTDDDGHLLIDVYVIIRYGINLASVANSLISTIRYHVESRTNLSVKSVHIHIQGVRMQPENSH